LFEGEVGVEKFYIAEKKENKMVYKICAIIFEVTAQKYADGRFSVPVEICNILGVKCNDEVYITIKTLDKSLLYSGVKKLASGREIYGIDIRKTVKKGQRISVTVSREK
jgi:hypothetical protein